MPNNNLPQKVHQPQGAKSPGISLGKQNSSQNFHVFEDKVSNGQSGKPKKPVSPWLWILGIVVIGGCLACCVGVLLMGNIFNSAFSNSSPTATWTPENILPAPQPATSSDSSNVHDNTRVLNSNSVETLVSVSDDGAVYTFDNPTGELQNLSAGDVIVAGISEDAPYGLLRKVETVSMPNGQVVLQTSPAGLEDVFEECDIDVTRSLSPADAGSMLLPPGVTLANMPSSGGFAEVSLRRTGKGSIVPAPLAEPFRFNIDNLVLHDEDNLSSTRNDQVVANGYVEITPTLVYQEKIRQGQRQTAYIAVETRQNVNLKIDSRVTQTVLDTEVEIGRISPKFEIPINGVPVVIAVPLIFNVGVDGRITGQVSTGVIVDNTLRVGVEYGADTWSPIAQNDLHSVDFLEPVLSGNQEYTGYAGVRLAVLLYGIAGPDATLKKYLRLEADTRQEPWWVLYEGEEVSVGIHIETGLKPIDYDFSLVINERQVLTQAGPPVSPPVITITPSPTPSTPVYEPLPWNYECPDLSGVKLRVGMWAKIVFAKVNLRSTPEVPNDFYANIIAELDEGEKVKIIDGPACAHDGTWWMVKTTAGEGWIREFQPGKQLLVQIK